MKNLSLLMFVILILGCDTETPVVEEPEPVIEEHTPTVVSGERFRFSGDVPQLVWGTVLGGEDNVDPDPINAGGFRFDFDEDLKLHKIAILLDGEPLYWLPVDMTHLVTHVVTLRATAGEELQFDTEYVIKIYVQDVICQSSRFEIRFRTMPKP